jgi:GAF domain-containing protein
VLPIPLPVQERVLGALSVYARETAASPARTRELVARFATYAVVPVSNMYLYEAAVERADQLQAAPDARTVIDQAKVRDVAQRFVDTGEFRAG